MISRDLARQVVSFGLVGGAATLVHVSVALSLNAYTVVGPIGANLAAYLCAFGVSYLGNSILTFRRPAASGARMSRFLVVSVAGLGLNQAIVVPLVALAHLPLKLALVPAVLIVPIATFVVSRLWVFGAGDQATALSAVAKTKP